jgi:hypothetical protein
MHRFAPLLGALVLQLLGCGAGASPEPTTPASEPAAVVEAAPAPVAVAEMAPQPAATPSRTVAAPDPAPAGTVARTRRHRLVVQATTRADLAEGTACLPLSIEGWDGDAACAARARVWAEVPGADRACGDDADCRPVVAGHCRFSALNAGGAAQPRYAEAACGGPNEGMCIPGWEASPPTVTCVAGCCATADEASARRVGAERRVLRAFMGAVGGCGGIDALPENFTVRLTVPRSGSPEVGELTGLAHADRACLTAGLTEGLPAPDAPYEAVLTATPSEAR